MKASDTILLHVASVEDFVDSVIHETCKSIASSVVLGSPYGDWDNWSNFWKEQRPKPPYIPGHFVSNWEYNVNLPIYIETPGVATKHQKISAIEGELIKKGAHKFIHYLSNSTSYALNLELGSSPQAPYGIVSHIFPMIKYIFQRSVWRVTNVVS
jgi:hypothetical protein